MEWVDKDGNTNLLPKTLYTTILYIIMRGLKMETINKPTRDEVVEFERVRQSGLTNMFDITAVSNLSGLNRGVILKIMKKYSELVEEYGIDRNDVDSKGD